MEFVAEIENHMYKPARITYYIYLGLTCLGMIFGSAYFLTQRTVFLATNPGMQPYFWAYVGTALVTALGALLALLGRYWGLFLVAGGLLAALYLEWMAGFDWTKIARIPVAIFLLILIDRWNRHSEAIQSTPSASR